MTRFARIAIHEAGHATAALIYNIPIVRVSIDGADAGLEWMAALCLASPASEEMFCGSIEGDSD
jgi:hypothetical protein